MVPSWRTIVTTHCSLRSAGHGIQLSRFSNANQSMIAKSQPYQPVKHMKRRALSSLRFHMLYRADNSQRITLNLLSVKKIMEKREKVLLLVILPEGLQDSYGFTQIIVNAPLIEFHYLCDCFMWHIINICQFKGDPVPVLKFT